mmetsp:Transcript_35604/g.42523  ORF Transcript_35604/g.42523 Transcript_35604/m.42523 type:complete len:261 (+) Transcript_35604:362-1144(+)
MLCMASKIPSGLPSFTANAGSSPSPLLLLLSSKGVPSSSGFIPRLSSQSSLLISSSLLSPELVSPSPPRLRSHSSSFFFLSALSLSDGISSSPGTIPRLRRKSSSLTFSSPFSSSEAASSSPPSRPRLSRKSSSISSSSTSASTTDVPNASAVAAPASPAVAAPGAPISDPIIKSTSISSSKSNFTPVSPAPSTTSSSSSSSSSKINEADFCASSSSLRSLKPLLAPFLTSASISTVAHRPCISINSSIGIGCSCGDPQL